MARAAIEKESPSLGLIEDSKTDAAQQVNRFFTNKDDLLSALSSGDFYLQMVMIGIALALAWLMAVLIRSYTKRHLEKHPPRRIDIEFILKPLSLLGPLLAVLYLSVIKPFADEFMRDGDWVEAATQLCLAYFLAKAVVLIVRSKLVSYFIAFVIMAIAALRATGFMRSTVLYLNSMAFDVGKFHISMLSLVQGLIILVVVFWLAALLSRTLESYLRRSSRLSYTARELTVKFFRIFVYFVAFMITLSAVGVDLTAFAVFGGALGVGIGLGLQKITANFVSGMTLLMEKSIQIGDLIEVAGNTGWVRQLNIRYALLETADGREIMIPNEELVSTRVTSWTHTTTLARVEIKVKIKYNSDAGKAKALMLEAARELKLCLKDPAPTCWLREFTDNGVQFLLTFWIPDVKEGRNGPQSDVMFAILDKFSKENIEMPTSVQEMTVKLGGATDEG